MVRTLASALPPREQHRAHWADVSGSISALAALERGQPCGFSLSCAGRWAEWTVHPVLLASPDT
ncbi:hypothetical protein [Streptomyces gobiensis]|uniref:hypothetical protein n=1 Tax=Streptomyces gobiensis TaxID=2875706 RepID=UPI001E4986CA|nr:hypothetical protein [Streptomyces gobiensis]UGY90280.1 hypothetical protein test1122_00075 [Streptomyces gobiensis]UGY94931.1 hypothetical protein test1122_26465 [Streptomyces gobiensis]